MQITKKINNNVALGIDAKGKEVVLFGKGIGFPKIPYELKDLTLVSKMFYDVDSQYLPLLTEIDESIIHASSKIVDYVKSRIDFELNPSLTFTLADHINFSIIRLENKIDVTNPLTNDIKYLYKTEMEIGYKGLEIIKNELGIDFPSCEASSIALHIKNAEGLENDMPNTIKTTKVLKEIIRIVEDYSNKTIDQDSLDYSRFIIHLKHFVQHIQKPQHVNASTKKLLETFILQCPETYDCYKKIDEYLKSDLHWDCTEEDELYLMVHLNRLLNN